MAKFHIMSPGTLLPPQQIRTLLHERIDQLRDEDLELARQQMDLLDMKRRLDALCEDYGGDWQSGRVTQKMVDDSIRDYRASHAYRSPGRPWE